MDDLLQCLTSQLFVDISLLHDIKITLDDQ